MPWQVFFSELSASGYDGAVTIEVEYPDFETLNDRKRAVILSRDFLQPYFNQETAKV